MISMLYKGSIVSQVEAESWNSFTQIFLLLLPSSSHCPTLPVIPISSFPSTSTSTFTSLSLNPCSSNAHPPVSSESLPECHNLPRNFMRMVPLHPGCCTVERSCSLSLLIAHSTSATGVPPSIFLTSALVKKCNIKSLDLELNLVIRMNM